MVTGVTLAMSIYELVTATSVQPRAVDVLPSSSSPDEALDIAIRAQVQSFPRHLSISLKSARCALTMDGQAESLTLQTLSENLVVSSAELEYSLTTALSVDSVAALVPRVF